MSPTQDTNQLIACLVLAIVIRKALMLSVFRTKVGGHGFQAAIKDSGRHMVAQLASVLNSHRRPPSVDRHLMAVDGRLMTYVRLSPTIDHPVDLEPIPI